MPEKAEVLDAGKAQTDVLFDIPVLERFSHLCSAVARGLVSCVARG